MRIVVAMSGGVDSSVCASLLKNQGHEIIGVTIKTWTDDACKDERSKGCCSLRDIDDARHVARKLDIPYYVMDLSGDFRGKVVDYFVEEYLQGRTPNPCIECNRHIKFGVLLDKASQLGADYVATGHYARRGYDPVSKRYFIQEGLDSSKDQSYVLFGQTQDQLKKTLLPLGELSKSQVRDMAKQLDLRVFDKPDSQEICFVRSSYIDFMQEHVPDRLPSQGNFVDKEGRVLGQHKGFHHFTVGQRKRLHFPKPEPMYVTKIDAEKNQVTIGAENQLLQQRLCIRNVNWMLIPEIGQKVFVKIRYKHQKALAQLESFDKDQAWVVFDEPQKALCPGQAAVMYLDDKVLGGGWIV